MKKQNGINSAKCILINNHTEIMHFCLFTINAVVDIHITIKTITCIYLAIYFQGYQNINFMKMSIYM